MTLENLTLTRGKSPTTGGGLFNGSNLTLHNVAVTANRADLGGGIVQAGGTLTLAAGTRVTGNFAIWEVTANGGRGGGIWMPESSTGLLILEAGSSVTGNTANNAGGGIWTYSPSAVTIQAGSTVSNNTVDNCEPTIGTCT